MTVLIDKKYNWQHLKCEGVECWFIGSERYVKQFFSYLKDHPNAGIKALNKVLAGLFGNFAFIVEQSFRIIVAVDKIRSYPVFYYHEGSRFQVSNSARALKDALRLEEIDDLSFLELNMAGYVTGRRTAFKHLYQFQAGEILVWDKLEIRNDPYRTRYFRFYSQATITVSADELIDEVVHRTDTIFRRIAEQVGDRRVWVPLSGGLDSRLVLCKLKEHGCERLNTFSWGVPGNREAAVAGRVAELLGVPWFFVPDTHGTAREYFSSEERASYWDFADGLHVVPNLNQQCALKVLIKTGRMEPGDVIINGQSGDFIAGAHIPDICGPYSSEFLLDRIMAKHYYHRRDLLTQENTELVRSCIRRLIQEHTDRPVDGENEFARQYELWEWQERQTKRVVNGQRNYDFLGLNWELPLWECEYLDFWRRVPVSFKKKRWLFVEYVSQMDFYGLFRRFKPRLSRWPGKRIMIQYFGHFVKLFLGSKISQAYYEKLDYFSQYGNLFAQLSYPEFLRLSRTHKSPLAIYAQHWIEENLLSELDP